MLNKINKIIQNEMLKYKENPLKYIFEMATVGSMIIFLVSLPLFTYNAYSYITAILGGIFCVLAFIWLFFFNKFIFERSVVALTLFVLFVTISGFINSFENFYRTIYVLPIMFIALYEFTVLGKKTQVALISFAVSILLFSFVYIVHYWSEIISLDFDRLGADFAVNVNQVGSLFSYGAALFSYLSIVRRKYLFIIPTIIVVFLGISTGSKSFLLDALICVAIEIFYFFGFKKWRVSLLIIASALVLLIIVLQLDVFATIRERLNDMVQYVFTGISRLDPSTNERLAMANEALYLFLKKPFFGWGFKGVSIYGSYGTYSHNTITEILANFGFFAFVAFEYPVFEVLKSAFARRKEHNVNFGIPIVFVSTMIFQQFTGVKFETKEYYIALAIALAILNEGRTTEKFMNFSSVKQSYKRLLGRPKTFASEK